MKEKEEEEVKEKEEELLDPEEEELDESGEPEITNLRDLWSYARENLPELSVSFSFISYFTQNLFHFINVFFLLFFCHIKYLITLP